MIKNPFFNYLNKLTFFSIAVCFVVMLLWLTPIREYLRLMPYYICMYYVVTLAFWCFLRYVPNKTKLTFEHAYMITKIGKILVYALIFVIILLLGLEKSTKFAFAYLGLYLVYLVFDTITLVQLVKENKNKEK